MRRSRSRPTARPSATNGRRRAASASSTSSTPRSSAPPSRRPTSSCSSLGRPAAAASSGSPTARSLELNTLGDPETREAWRDALIDYFRGHRADLSGGQPVARLERNPLRILDSKDPKDRPICRRCAERDRRFPDRRGRGLLRRGNRRSRRRGRAVEARAAARARPRLLSPHRVRVRHRPPRRARHGDRRRPLRRPDRSARRTAYAGGRLGRRDRAAGDDDRRAASARSQAVVLVPLGERAEAEAAARARRSSPRRRCRGDGLSRQHEEALEPSK